MTPNKNFTEDGYSKWFKIGNRTVTLYASGEFGTGSVSLETCTFDRTEDPNNATVTEAEVFPLASSSLSEKGYVTVEGNFVWVRAALASSTDPDLNIYLFY
jgi:hypothetical protein